MRSKCLVCLLLAGLGTLNSGCARQLLNHETKQTTENISDVLYAQVIHNLASTAANQWAVPSQASFLSGEVTVNETIAPSAQFTIVDGGNLGNRVLQLGGSGALTAKWTITPIHGKDLRRLQLWYRWAIGTESPKNDQFDSIKKSLPDTIQQLFELRIKRAGDVRQVPPQGTAPNAPAGETPDVSINKDFWPARGWLRFDAPTGEVAFCATCDGVTVWVPKDRREDFTKFAMLVLDEVSAPPGLVVTGNTGVGTP